MQRCMIVEKSAVVRKVSKRILSETAMIVEAETAEQALAMCEAEMPDQIIVEANVAGMDVYEFIRTVRSIQSDIKPIIVLMMVEMDIVQMTKAKRAGADDYLLKPFDRSQLLARYEQIVEQADKAAA